MYTFYVSVLYSYVIAIHDTKVSIDKAISDQQINITTKVCMDVCVYVYISVFRSMQPPRGKSLKLKSTQGSKLGRVTEVDASMELMQALVKMATLGKSSAQIDASVAQLIEKNRVQKQVGPQDELPTRMNQPLMPLPINLTFILQPWYHFSHFRFIDIEACLAELKGKGDEIIVQIEFPDAVHKISHEVIRSSLRTLSPRWMYRSATYCWLNDEVTTEHPCTNNVVCTETTTVHLHCTSMCYRL